MSKSVCVLSFTRSERALSREPLPTLFARVRFLTRVNTSVNGECILPCECHLALITRVSLAGMNVQVTHKSVVLMEARITLLAHIWPLARM